MLATSSFSGFIVWERLVEILRNPQARVIIARFLRYPDCEAVFARRSSLADTPGLGIDPDLPKEVVDMRKKLIPRMLEARKQEKELRLVDQNRISC